MHTALARPTLERTQVFLEESLRMKRFYTASLLSLALAGAATANIIPTGSGVTGVGTFTWSYTLTLSSDQNANVGLAPTTNPVGASNIGQGAFFTLV